MKVWSYKQLFFLNLKSLEAKPCADTYAWKETTLDWISDDVHSEMRQKQWTFNAMKYDHILFCLLVRRF